MIRGGLRAYAVAAALFAALAAPVPARAAAEGAPTTVILVRHAEKNPHPAGGDAGLSTKGLIRARELERAVRDAGVDAIYASQYGRSQLTARAVADGLGDSVRTYDANRNDLLAERIRREHRGGTVLVVGHGDSLPELFTALTGERLRGDEGVGYDRLFVLTLPAGGGHALVRLRYGAVPADAVAPAPASTTVPTRKSP